MNSTFAEAEVNTSGTNYDLMGVAVLPPEIYRLRKNGLLTDTEVWLIIIIGSLGRDAVHGCFASNRYLSDALPSPVSEGQVRRMLVNLIRLNVVVRKYVGKRRCLWTRWTKFDEGTPLPPEAYTVAPGTPPATCAPGAHSGTPPATCAPGAHSGARPAHTQARAGRAQKKDIEEEGSQEEERIPVRSPENAAATPTPAPATESEKKWVAVEFCAGWEGIAEEFGIKVIPPSEAPGKKNNTAPKELPPVSPKEPMKELPPAPPKESTPAELARTLHEALLRQRRLTVKPSLQRWEREMRLLVEAMGAAEVGAVLAWFCVNMTYRYCPKNVYSAAAFRTEYPRIRQAMEWHAEARQKEAAADDPLLREVLQELKEEAMAWPKGAEATLADVGGKSVQWARSFFQWMRKEADREYSSTCRGLMKQLLKDWQNPYDFVKRYLMDWNAKVQTWPSWSGQIPALSEKHMAVYGREAATQYGEVLLWNDLMDLWRQHDGKGG